jgi:F0F1-type ATP synthase membrane subunit b/b'
MKISFRKCGLILVAGLVLALTPVYAQEAQQQEQGSPQQQSSEQQARPENPNRAVGKELAEASKAAEGEGSEKEDQTTGLKHSVAVRWIAKTTGMSVETAYWIAMVFNFAIVILGVAWLMKSSLPGYFRSRNQQIQRGNEEARAASADAQRRLTDVEARLSRMDAEVAEIRAMAEKESAAEEARIRAAAEADVKRIMESAEQEIDAAGRQARRDLKGLAAGLAVDLAAGKLHVDAETDESLVRNFVSQLGKDGR